MPTESISKPKRPAFRSKGLARLITVLKFALPAVAVIIILTVTLWPHFQPHVDRFRIGLAVLGERASEGPSMINAHFSGIDAEGRAFSIKAQTLTQSSEDSAFVQLAAPEADITLNNGAWLALTADSGIFNRDTETLELTGSVTLFHDAGYEMRTSRSVINLETGTASGTEPVEAQGPNGELKAEGFRFADGGSTIFFDGRSTLLIYPGTTGTLQ